MSPGFHDISAEQYHDDRLVDAPTLSCSIAQIMLRESPRKAWFSHRKLNPDYAEDRDPKFDLGTAAHAMLLEKDASRITIVQADDWRTKAAKEARAAANAEGKTALLARHYDAVRKMVDIALAFIEESDIMADLWHDAKPEVTALWCEGSAKDLIWLKARFDKFSAQNRWIFDFKSTDNAAPDVFQRQMFRLSMHVQEAFYRRAAVALGVESPKFAFLAQSVEPPHECSWHACDPALQEIADAQVERAIGIWRQCIKSNNWPSYGNGIHYAIPSAFMMAEHELAMQGEA